MSPRTHVVATAAPGHRRLVWLVAPLAFLVTAVLVAWPAGGARPVRSAVQTMAIGGIAAGAAFLIARALG